MKNIYCLIGLTFIVANIVISINPNIKKENKEFLNSLTDLQKIMYTLVKKERLQIYTIGTFLGITLGLIVLYLVRKKNNLFNGCFFMTVVFVTQYFYYILSPKNYSMVETLKGKEQLKEWNDVYKEYQWSYHIGMVIAVIGYFLVGFSL